MLWKSVERFSFYRFLKKAVKNRLTVHEETFLTKKSHRQLLLVIKLFIEQVQTVLLCLPEHFNAILEKNDILIENYI